MANLKTAEHAELMEIVQGFRLDPLGFVRFAYPWGEPGPLEHEIGPDENQAEFLTALGEEVRKRNFDGHTPVMPVRLAETSGHGTGKSVTGAWIADWILSTRPGSIGTVTAGTATQLSERTWAAIQSWTKLCITAPWFEIQSSGIYAYEDPENWKVVCQTCKEENAQSFAGQHASTSTSWYLFDEASIVPDGIWKVAYGGLTDGEPMIFAWGQPERNTGHFYEICFGRERDRWNHRRVDSRNSRFTNKTLIEEWRRDYGEESDWFRVRVLGLPPRASELQYIDQNRVEEARQRQVYTLRHEPLIAGFDVSGGGAAWNVIRFRRGLDGRAMPPVRIPGEQGRDRDVLVGVCAELLRDERPGHRIAAMFVDSAFGAPIVERLHVLGFQKVFEVNFGGRSPDPHQENMRAFMYAKAKDWLVKGGVPADDEHLARQLCVPGYHINRSGRLVLESKADIQKRGEVSPDDADAFVLTFAQQVAPPEPTYRERPSSVQVTSSDLWMT
jgi:hypothetical protein